MRQVGMCAFSAATLLAAAGMALGQKATTGTGADRSESGDPILREWRIGPGRSLRIGTNGVTGSELDLTQVFVPAGADPEADSHAAAAYLPDGSGVVIANRASKNLTIFNPTTRALIRNIPLSGSPQSLAITPDGSKAVTANLFEGTASIVDLATGAELHTITVGANPVTARITPSGTTAVVASNGPQNMAVIDIATGAVQRTIATGGYQTTFSANFESQGIGFQSTGPTVVDNTTVLYPDYNHNQVLAIDITTGATTTIATAANPVQIVVAGTKAYVSHAFSIRTVSEIDIPTHAVTRTFTTFSDVNGPIAVNPSGTRLVVAVQNACEVIDLPSGSVSGDLSTASVNQLITTADGNYALAVGFFGSLISFDTQSVVTNTNQFVSASIGAVSPVAPQAAMFSDTFGEDMVIVSTNGASAGLLSAGPTGPVPEGDKTRVAAVTPNGAKAVGVNQFSQTATIVDTATHAQLAIAATGRRPGSCAIAPDGSKAVIANRDGTDATVINLSTYASSAVPISTRGDQVQISPDGHYAYIAVVVADGVWRIDLNTLAAAGPELSTGNMGSYFQNYSAFSGMTLSHNGATLVTCDSFDNQLTVIDTASWSVIGHVALGAGNFPVRAVFSPDDSKIYVSDRDSDRVSVVSNAGAGSSVIGTITVGDSPTEMVINADGSRLYVMNTGTPTNVGVVNTATMTQTSTIAFTTNPTIDGFALNPDGSRLYVSHSNGAYTIGMGGFTIAQSEVLSVVDTSNNSVVETVPGPNLASGLAIAGNGSALAMPNLMSEGLTIVNLGSVCYANCDGSTAPPVLNVNDFICFQSKFAAGDPYANCDGSTNPPVLNVNDFICFQTSFAAGCP